jgi:dTDP-4-amino-4,6-dideoxygalactose transaminase
MDRAGSHTKKNAVAVPLLDLRTQYHAIKNEVDTAIQRVIDSQQFINGPEVAAFEQQAAEYCQVKHCIGVSSGSDALLIALMALDIQPGDEVISTPYTFFATAGAVVRMGARPVFVDIDPATFNIQADQVEERITSRTRAIMPVHLFGQCADMEPILAVARRRGVAVIEDAAQAIGAEYKGQRAGAMGDMGCFSFFPSKNLGAFGDGGAVVTNDDALADRLLMLRNHGARPKYFHKIVGGNFRLDTIQAAVLSVKLRSLDQWTAKRQQHAAFYDAAIARDARLRSTITSPAIVQSRHIFNQYVIRVRDRDALREHLQQNQVGNEVYYPVPLHLQECFRDLGYRPGDFPESELAAATTVALPIFPELTTVQKQQVVDSLTSFCETSQVRRTQAA